MIKMVNLISIDSNLKTITDNELMDYHTNLHVYFRKILDGFLVGGMASLTVEKIHELHENVVVEIHNRGLRHIMPLDELDTIKMMSGKSQNYSVGILSDEKIDPEQVINFEGQKYMKLGNVTGNIDAKVGDNILITAEKAMKETTENGIKYTVKKMSVIKTIKDCDTVVKLSERAIEKEKEMSDDGGITKITDFPKEMQESFNKMFGKWSPYVIQKVLSDKIAVIDIRFDVGDHLEGFRLLSVDINDQKDIECFVKSPHKKEWLNFEGKSNNKMFGIINKGLFSPVKIDDYKILLKMRNDRDVGKRIDDVVVGRFSFDILNEKMLFNKVIGRPTGTSNLTGDLLKQIWNLTKKGTSRMDISRELEMSSRTIWKYQRSLGLV